MACAMILFIKFSGGMGVSYQGSVDLSALPDDLLQEVQTELSEKNLAKINTVKRDPFAADSIIYEIQYDKSGKKFIIDESQTSDNILELIDNLRPYLTLESRLP